MKNKMFNVVKGLTVAFMLFAGVHSASAQITTTASTTPGMPTTGAAGNATMNLTLLASSLVVIAAGVYAFRVNKKSYTEIRG